MNGSSIPAQPIGADIEIGTASGDTFRIKGIFAIILDQAFFPGHLHCFFQVIDDYLPPDYCDIGLYEEFLLAGKGLDNEQVAPQHFWCDLDLRHQEFHFDAALIGHFEGKFAKLEDLLASEDPTGLLEGKGLGQSRRDKHGEQQQQTYQSVFHEVQVEEWEGRH